MIRITLLFCIAGFICSCSKQEVGGFDNTIQYAQDFRIDPNTGDTVYTFFMPNGFTPDADGLNDIYHVWGEGIDPEVFEMKIYSREGNLIYVTDDVQQGYDGAVQGSGEYGSNQVLTVDVNVSDTLGSAHHYHYDILQVR